MRVKVCGITNLADALAAARLGADCVGFIRAHSPRQIPLARAAEIIRDLPDRTSGVLVYRDAELAEVVDALTATGCTWVQLHGQEPVEYLAELRRRVPRARIIKTWEVASLAAAAPLRAFLDAAAGAAAAVDVVLLDVPKASLHPGYACLAAVAQSLSPRPPEVWLAGGLTPGNVTAAVVGARFDGVDVASGVELRPGVKDHAALRAFVESAKLL
jgi:phosphoribosylanthranilate isomerase